MRSSSSLSSSPPASGGTHRRRTSVTTLGLCGPRPPAAPLSHGKRSSHGPSVPLPELLQGPPVPAVGLAASGGGCARPPAPAVGLAAGGGGRACPPAPASGRTAAAARARAHRRAAAGGGGLHAPPTRCRRCGECEEQEGADAVGHGCQWLLAKKGMGWEREWMDKLLGFTAFR